MFSHRRREEEGHWIITWGHFFLHFPSALNSCRLLVWGGTRVFILWKVNGRVWLFTFAIFHFSKFDTFPKVSHCYFSVLCLLWIVICSLLYVTLINFWVHQAKLVCCWSSLRREVYVYGENFHNTYVGGRNQWSWRWVWKEQWCFLAVSDRQLHYLRVGCLQERQVWILSYGVGCCVSFCALIVITRLLFYIRCGTEAWMDTLRNLHYKGEVTVGHTASVFHFSLLFLKETGKKGRGRIK